MAKAANVSREEIIFQSAQSALTFVREPQDLRKDLDALIEAEQELNRDIKELKEHHNIGGKKRALIETQKLLPVAVDVHKKLRKMNTGEAAMAAMQILHIIKVGDFLAGDLVTLMQESQAMQGTSRADAGQGAIFDQTSEGQRRGGPKGAPKLTIVENDPPAPPPTEGISLTEALARFEENKAKALSAYEAEKKLWPGKGRKSNQFKAAEAALEIAEKELLEAQAAADAENAGKAAQEPDDFDTADYDDDETETGAETVEHPAPPAPPAPPAEPAPPPPRAAKKPRQEAAGGDDEDETDPTSPAPDAPPKPPRRRGAGHFQLLQ